MQLLTPRLRLLARSRKETLESIDAMSPEDRLLLAPEWLTLVYASAEYDPWCHGFTLVSHTDSSPIGQCGFKGPPNPAGAVEIAYGIAPEHQGKGFATEAAQALVQFAFSHPAVHLVRAHTLPTGAASARVLRKSGFLFIGEFSDPIDGLVHRYECPKPPPPQPQQ